MDDKSVTLNDLLDKLYLTNEYGNTYQNPNAVLSEEEIQYAKNRWDIKTDTHRTCVNCQIRQHIKYDTGKEFKVSCKFIQHLLPPGSKAVLNQMVLEQGIEKDRAYKILQASIDPVAWCELMFGFSDTDPYFHIRSYQKEQLRCTSERMVIREGRRAGKALSVNTPIPTPIGWKTMKELQPGDQVFDETGTSCNVIAVTEIMQGRPCYKITFNDDTEIIADAEHEWAIQTKSMRKSNCRNRFKKHDLILKTTEQMYHTQKVGKKQESNYSIPTCKPLNYSYRELPIHPYVLGYWLGDGTRNCSGITIGIKDQIESIQRIQSYGYTVTARSSDKLAFGITGLITKLKLLGIENIKRIPRIYLEASVEQRLELLKGLMDTDGSIDDNGTAELTSSYPELAADLYELITGLGIKASMNQGESWFNNRRYNDRYRIYFNPSIQVFHLKRKANKIQLEKSFAQKNRFIVKIEKIESVPVKCIQVDSPNHLYLASRACIPTHNSFCIALKLLYLAFNKTVTSGNDSEGNPVKRGPKIMVITPFQTQLTGLFDEMEKLLNRNQDLVRDVESQSGSNLYVKTPYFHMDFRNGAIISGHVSGVGTKADGSGGGTIRGSGAEIIYLDEMDMISEETIDKVVMPILLTDLRGETILIATSTPIGKRAHFYKWSKESPFFKEDYLPSTVLPQWNKILQTLDVSPGSEAFRTEYMAEFVDGTYGVFKPPHVYRSFREFQYLDTENMQWWKNRFHIRESNALIRCIGIDWNQNAGTEFVVVAYSPQNHIYVVCESVNIAASEFSALRWREELIRLNYKWKPDYIYADEGYGHTIIEDLKVIAHNISARGIKHLQDAETVKLKERLKAFGFKRKISLRDPVTNLEIEKEGKEFLVENAKRILEDPGKNNAGILWIPLEEKVLKEQLLHYIVKKISVTTRKPVYESDSAKIADHRLDAFMLAVAGIQIESGIYSTRNAVKSAPGFSLAEQKEETPKTQSPNLLQILERKEHQIVPRKSDQPKLNEVEKFFKSKPDYSKYNNDNYTGDPKIRSIQPRRGGRR